MTLAEVQCLDLGGTWRSRQPQELLDALQWQLPRLGISRIADITGLDCIGIPVAVCIRPNAKNLAVAQGKGVTPLLATVSALMESIEDYHSENPRAPDLYGTPRELSKTVHLVMPNQLSPGYFPGILDERRAIGWLRATNIANHSDVYVPQVWVNMNTTEHRPEYAALAISTTGLASGAHRDEAICHALCEIIEHDAHARWVKLPLSERMQTKLDLSSVGGLNARLLERYASAGIGVKVWEMPSPTAVPAYRCLIRERDPSRCLGSFSGMGAHLSPEIALSRALTEAAQSRLTLISGSRDDMFSEVYARQRQAMERRVNVVEPAGTRPFHPGLQRQPAHFAALRDELVQRLTTAMGLTEVIVVEHELDVGVSVVHAFVPGMLDLPL